MALVVLIIAKFPNTRQYIRIRDRFGGGDERPKEGWLKSISDPIVGAEGAENLKSVPHWGQKWPILEIFAAPKALQEFFSKNIPKNA